MKQRIKAALIVFALAVCFAPKALSSPAADLTISAAISLKDSLDEITRLYHAESPDVTVHANYGASGTLQRQIEEGAPVDIFVSASPNQMDALEAKGLVLAGTRRNLVENTVVLIVPKGKTNVAGFADLTHSDVKNVAIGEPRTVPAGKYAQETLTHLGLYDQLKRKFVLAKDVRQVLTFVATGDADAGIVYATDAKISDQVTVVATAPEDSHSPVIYPAAILKSSKNPDAAKALLDFFAGAKAREVFEKYGFIRGE